jgi:ATP-dependent Lon protease
MPNDNLPLLPLTSGVLLPGMVFTMALESEEAAAAVEAAEAADGSLVIVPFIDGRYASVGVVAEVAERGELPGGMGAVAVRGVGRVRLGTAVPGTGRALWVEVESVGDDTDATGTAVELAREYRAVVENILVSRGAGRLAERLPDAADPGRVADLAGYSPDLTLEQKVSVLETIDVVERLRLVLGWARDVLADITLRERIKTDVEEGMEQTQREFLLRRQLEAIRKELGEDDGDEPGPDDYRTRAAGRDLPEHVASAVAREIGRLERTPEQSPEHGWIRTWLDTVLELPWGIESEERVDLAEAARILDEDHDGLSDVKDRILEHLAVRKLQIDRHLAPVGGRGAGAILALVGPPGVGKTSLGESVARALGRPFVRVALGGVRDEAEIRGHRRTYVGAQPGRLVRALREAGSMNPVVLLDEVDKLGSDFRGDPSSALLEVLDPAQNHTFRDHYLEVELDLSKVLFLATANVVDTVPGPLLDRMEVIRLDGYTEDEKVAIARNHLVDRQRSRAALSEDDVTLTDDALRSIVADHTREAGVRGLERELGTLMRKVAGRVAAGDQVSARPLVVDGPDVWEWLGRPRFFFESADRDPVPGVATGLAVTGAGGDVLSVEVTMMDGPEGLTITGQLGDVMRESAEIALSYVRSHADALGIGPDAFAGKRLHVHVPAGAVPKDGPSAGVTMTTALVSLLTGRPVSPAVGMTGEVTLQGRVLPIGGVRQKVLAAHRAGLTTVVLPARNGPDIDDVPEAVRREMDLVLAARIDEVLDVALTGGTGRTVRARGDRSAEAA